METIQSIYSLQERVLFDPDLVNIIMDIYVPTWYPPSPNFWKLTRRLEMLRSVNKTFRDVIMKSKLWRKIGFVYNITSERSIGSMRHMCILESRRDKISQESIKVGMEYHKKLKRLRKKAREYTPIKCLEKLYIARIFEEEDDKEKAKKRRKKFRPIQDHYYS